MLQGCLRMITTALQHLTIFIARLVVQVYSGERVVERCALVTQAEVYWFHSQANPCLFAIPAFDRKAGLNNRHLNSNRGVCLR
jgi:hypothetical protein